MPFNVFTLAICVIFASLSLMFLPDFMLIGRKQMLFCHLAFVLTAVFFYWFKKIFVFRFFISLNIALLTLGYVHSFALDLLRQADEVSVQKQPLIFTIEEVLHQQAYQTVIVRTVLKERRGEQRIFLNWKAKERPFLGETWQGEVFLRPLSGRLNFGGFDRQKWYFSEGIIATGTVKSAVKIKSDFSLREKILQQALKQTEGLSLQGLLIALAFGERAWLDKTTQRIYQQTNTAHLIAISGLHIGLAMGIGFFLVRLMQFFLPTRFIHPFFPLFFGGIFALFYAYLAGFTVPTFRAISALIFISCIQIARRYYSTFQLFILVVAFLLLWDPLMPLSISFWLSVGAVCCLILWYRYVPFSLFQWRHQPFSQKVRWIMRLFHLQFGLFLLFTPLQLFFFNGIALNGFFANLIAVPFYSFFLVPLILFAVLSKGACSSWELANELAERITQVIAYFQGSWFAVSSNVSLVLTALCSLIFLLIIYGIYREKPVTQQDWKMKQTKFFTLSVNKSSPRIELKQVIGISVSIAVLCLLIGAYRQYQKPLWQLDTLDVGQGLATLIVKDGRGILYDTGAAWQGGSMAESEILPYLQREGIEPDKLILSHDDNDHSGGTRAILKAYPHLELVSSSEKTYGETDRTSCIVGKSWQWRGISFRVLSPEKSVARADNVDSCVILIDDGQYRVLLTGDAETKNERFFARTLGKLNVLQVGHHGSKTSTGEFLLAQTQPDISIISSGRWNPWKFPHSSVTERLTRYKSAVENTAFSGQIRVGFYRNKITIDTARDAFSPWYARVIGLSNE
ncbi:DNA internalization-related competence protein ComEC/Rec2 [Rodentibacter haemolyticus]|uniref:DNA internalization-related competence protein ComEC/Rec2 n=1 Tax=Rodentibacter haemolyticus TaxID=2778911 RepID=A0ABX6UX32_9PAST|nr:DNA internalization-related competence protein ComEC/Rec2 [Rodentibacter haemolyticus]QPB42334.1 DNA internalization-related competence protein ComEC/Rec2 [Rodentibacter haemolyticus]